MGGQPRLPCRSTARVRSWAVGAFLVSLPFAAASVADIVGCLRLRAGGYSYPGAIARVCTAYTKCPTIMFCTSPGIAARSIGILPNTAAQCIDYIGGTWDPVAGVCVGGTVATTPSTPWVAIPVDRCADPCTLKLPDDEE